MAVRDERPVASDRPYPNQPLGWQSPSHGYENNPHPTQPHNDPRSNRDQVHEPYPSTYQSQPPLKNTGYGCGHNPPPVQPQVYHQADVPPPKHGNGYLEPRLNRDQVNEPYPPPYQSQPQVRPALISELSLRTTGYGYGHNRPSIQPQVYHQADVPSPKHGNGYPEPRSNRDQVNEPYPSAYQSQPQARPALSSEPPLRTTGYDYGNNPPLIQPQGYHQADVPPPKHGNGYPEPRPNRAQVNERYSSPRRQEHEGGHGGSNSAGHRLPPTEAKMYEGRQQNPLPVTVAKPKQPHISPAVHGNGEKNRLDSYTNPTQPQEKEAHNHGGGNYQSDRFNDHEHNPLSGTVKPPATVSFNGYPATDVTARVEPKTHTQGQPYQDPSTQGLEFADRNKKGFNVNKPKEVPLPAGGQGTGHGHSYEHGSSHKGDKKSSVSPSGGQKLDVTFNFRFEPPGGQASANGSSKTDKGSDQSCWSRFSDCFNNCSIM